MLESKRRRR